jgi:hypothetical protein
MTAAVDADRVIRLIAARAPEIAPSDRDLIAAALSGGEAMISREVAERIVEVIDALAAKLDGIEEAA